MQVSNGTTPSLLNIKTYSLDASICESCDSLNPFPNSNNFVSELWSKKNYKEPKGS